MVQGKELVSTSSLQNIKLIRWQRPSGLIHLHPRVKLNFLLVSWAINVSSPSCNSSVERDLLGDLPKRLPLSETGSPAYTRTRLAQSSDLELRINTQHRLPRQADSRYAPSTSQWYGHKGFPPYFGRMVLVNFAHPTY